LDSSFLAAPLTDYARDAILALQLTVACTPRDSNVNSFFLE